LVRKPMMSIMWTKPRTAAPSIAGRQISPLSESARMASRTVPATGTEMMSAATRALMLSISSKRLKRYHDEVASALAAGEAGALQLRLLERFFADVYALAISSPVCSPARIKEAILSRASPRPLT
jgi:hypothetical protein